MKTTFQDSKNIIRGGREAEMSKIEACMLYVGFLNVFVTEQTNK